jgi:uncharacterized cupredoxin-like copper-binding protein
MRAKCLGVLAVVLLLAACGSEDPHWVIVTPAPSAKPAASVAASVAASAPASADPAGASGGPSAAPSDAAASAPAASSGGDATAANKATLGEFRIALSAYTMAAGRAAFTVFNQGAITHEFVIKKTELSDDHLPLTADGGINEDAPELGQVGEVADVLAGTTQVFEVGLTPGHYVFFCNLPTHYSSGMHGSFTVSG